MEDNAIKDKEAAAKRWKIILIATSLTLGIAAVTLSILFSYVF